MTHQPKQIMFTSESDMGRKMAALTRKEGHRSRMPLIENRGNRGRLSAKDRLKAAMADGEWYCYAEIQKRTGMSSKDAFNALKRMKRDGVTDRRYVSKPTSNGLSTRFAEWKLL